MNQRARDDGIEVSLGFLFPQEQGATLLPALSAYTQWKRLSPEESLARSEGVGLAVGMPGPVGVVAAAGCNLNLSQLRPKGLGKLYMKK